MKTADVLLKLSYLTSSDIEEFTNYIYLKRQLVARPGPTLTSYVAELPYFLFHLLLFSLKDLRRRMDLAGDDLMLG